MDSAWLRHQFTKESSVVSSYNGNNPFPRRPWLQNGPVAAAVGGTNVGFKGIVAGTQLFSINLIISTFFFVSSCNLIVLTRKH